MGMEVIGKAPRSKRGVGFRSSVWWWHPLWMFCEQTAPDIIPQNHLGHHNVGWGLDEKNACSLADCLQSLLDGGDIAGDDVIRNAEMHCMMGELCDLLNFTGERWHHGDHACINYGVGILRPRETCYQFSADNVRRFIAFLRDCGGFRIS
jgi:hypothetical protein